MVVQPIALCLSVGRFSAAFGSWKSLIQGRVGSSRPDRTPKISGKGDSGQPSCYGLFTSPWMGEVAAKRRVGVTARLLMPKLDRFKLRSSQRLRAAMTDEERILWRHLWRIPVEGTHFRKQASVGIYFPDFISHRLKLIIEVDGAHHSFDRQQRHDEVRTKWFESQGYRVIRSGTAKSKTNWIPCSIRSMRRWKNENQTFARQTPKALEFETPPPHPGADAPTLPIEGRVRSYPCLTCF